jgi:hypothetical protein
MNKETEVITGIVSDLKVINTRTGTNMVTFVLSGKCCKAFGDMAATLQASNDEQVEITARRGTYLGKPEYAVVNVKATIDGQSVTVTDARSNASAHNPLGLKNPGRHPGDPKDRIQQWILRFVDRLTDAEWKSWSTRWDRGWPGYPNESREARGASARFAGGTYNDDERELAAVLPAIKDRFESRLNEVRAHLSQENASAPTATQTPVPETSAKATSGEPPASRTAQDSPTVPSHLPPARASLPADDFAPVKRVTFEDLENQYKSQKMAREMEKLDRQGMKA